MTFFIIAVALFILGIVASFSNRWGYILAFFGSLASFATACATFSQKLVIYNIHLTDSIVLNAFLDKSSAVFLAVASLSWAAISLFSIDHGATHEKSTSAFFNIVFLSMLIVFVANDSITFLAGWELMTIFSFLLILIERRVPFGKAYGFLAYGELSALSLMAGFAYTYFTNHTTIIFQNNTAVFTVFASLGFLIKMDVTPFHTWMKDVYSKDPSNTCAILSAPMTLLGAYGISKIILSSSAFPQWWAITLTTLGAVSAFWGALQAVAASGVKTLPAYSTVENNGMILSILGLSALTLNYSSLNYLSHFAFVTAIILIAAHTFSKTLMFLSIGHAKKAYKADTIDDIRGIWKGVGKTPALGVLISSLSFSAFPPLAGYVGEWMLLESVFQSYKLVNDAEKFFTTVSGLLIALAIGLTGFSMVKLIGYTALGYDHDKKTVKTPSFFMKFSEIFLIILVILTGIGAPFIIKLSGYSYMLSGALSVSKPFLILSGKPVFGVLAPTYFAIVALVLFIVPFLIYLATNKRVKKVTSWNGGLELKEKEYFTADAYSYILKYILKKVYNTKEIKKNQVCSVVAEDRMEFFYSFFRNAFISMGNVTSRYLMNGKIYIYIFYILVIFILTFFIA